MTRKPIEVTAALKAHYPVAYGQWAGSPKGEKPDYQRCCEAVLGRQRWDHFSHQCSRPNGHGPDGAYCKAHDPKVVAERKATKEDRYKADLRNCMIGSMGDAVKALLAIEAGHNDPRALAKETLDKYRQRTWWSDKL